MTEQPSLQGISTNQGFDGFEFASFLLGGMSANSLNAPIDLSNNKSQTALYVQDTWKVTRKLTLDYGLRWDYGTYAHEQYGRNGSIGLAIPNPSASGRLGAHQFEATCKCNFANNYPYAIGPRLGLAYQINSKTVLRAGFGVVYNATSTAGWASVEQRRLQRACRPTPARSPACSRTVCRPASSRCGPRSTRTSARPPARSSRMPTLLDPNAGRPARLLQWNIGLQREISRNLVVEASYVANRGVWWTAQPALAPLNAMSQDTLRAYGFNDFTSATEARLLTTTVASLTTAQRSTLAARGITGAAVCELPHQSDRAPIAAGLSAVQQQRARIAALPWATPGTTRSS